MSSDFEELSRNFNGNNVKYLIVGGHAVMLCSEPRYMKALDVRVEASAENAAKIFRALAEFGAPLARLSPDDFAHEGFCYQVGLPPARVDILMSVDGLNFADAWPNRTQSKLGSEPAWFIGRADLVKNKGASRRHIDRHDAELLE
jgi:hypothetical protein